MLFLGLLESAKEDALFYQKAATQVRGNQQLANWMYIYVTAINPLSLFHISTTLSPSFSTENEEKRVTTVPEQCSIRASRRDLNMHKAKRTPRQISCGSFFLYLSAFLPKVFWVQGRKFVNLDASWTLWTMGLVRIPSWYPNFNGSHFGLPPSKIHWMTGLPPKIVWTMTYSHRPRYLRKFWCQSLKNWGFGHLKFKNVLGKLPDPQVSNWTQVRTTLGKSLYLSLPYYIFPLSFLFSSLVLVQLISLFLLIII